MSDQIDEGSLDAALGAALDQDAAATRPDMPPPPRRSTSTDPDAPHGRDDQGQPLAPYGLKADGKPRIKPAGPGRGHKADKPRLIDPKEVQTPSGGGGQAAIAADYSGELYGLGVSAWLGLSVLKGGKLPVLGIKVPDTRPVAYVWHENLDQMVGAWNNAARQNATVRGWVAKLGGDSSWAWVVGVGVASANFLAGCHEVLAKGNEQIRADAIGVNDQNLREFFVAQIAAANLQNQAAAGQPGDMAA